MESDEQFSIIDLNTVAPQLPSSLAEDVRVGFARTPKQLPPKYLYAIDGADIFDKITRLPEYYVTRAETAALEAWAADIVAFGSWSSLLELGPGSGKKTRYLLEPMLRRGDVMYSPVDLDKQILRQLIDVLLESCSGLSIRAFVCDFMSDQLDIVLPTPQSKLTAFLGSTLGNLNFDERQRLFRRLARHARLGDCFLIGVDLVKDRNTIEAAYNDSAGVTAEFNMNVLRALQRDLGANLDLQAFKHYAVYVDSECCIEMRLYAKCDLTISFGGADLPNYAMSAGDYILTELSYKFTRIALTDELSAAGLRLLGWWTDPKDLVALALASV